VRHIALLIGSRCLLALRYDWEGLSSLLLAMESPDGVASGAVHVVPSSLSRLRENCMARSELVALLAHVHWEKCDFAAAEELYAIVSTVAHTDADVDVNKREVCVCTTTLALISRPYHLTAAAFFLATAFVHCVGASVRACRQVPSTSASTSAARFEARLGGALFRTGKYGDAAAVLARAVPSITAELGDDHEEVLAAAADAKRVEQVGAAS
jgi:hypothetical protein